MARSDAIIKLMHKKTLRASTSGIRRQVVFLAVMLLFLYVVVPRIGGLSRSLEILKDVQLPLAGLALLAYIGIFAVGAAIYMLLAAKPLKYNRTLAAQVATGFTGKLLPVGLGTMGLMTQYLRRQKHTATQAVTVVGVNNILGMVGHGSLLALLVTVLRPALPILHAEMPPLAAIASIVLAVVVISFAFCKRDVRVRMTNAARDMYKQLATYRKRPLRLLGALGLSVMLTVLYTTVLYFSARALGHHLPFEIVFIIFSLGTFIGTATPTPGGIIGVEAGLVTGFAAYGLVFNDALVVALLYRLISYWLPLIPGFVAFLVMRKRYL